MKREKQVAAYELDALEAERRQARERTMFGATNADFKTGCTMTDFSDARDVVMLAMGIASDVQELVAVPGSTPADRERMRQMLNRSKWCMMLARDLMAPRV